MAEYPTPEEIREIGFDVDVEIEKLSSWQRSDIMLAEISTEVFSTSPAMLHAWAYLAEAIMDVSPTAKIDGYKVVRPISREELENAAMTAASTREYSRRRDAEKAEAKRQPTLDD
jgi:hypothetical protein